MTSEFLSRIQCVAFDVGETLVDETRMWSELAHRSGVTPLTLSGVLGALIAAGRDHSDLWDVLGVSRPAAGVDPSQGDLYPDALDCVAAVRGAGLIVGVAGNQPASVAEMLTAAGLEADFVASSASWGVSKPDPAFFARLVAAAHVPAESILYVGDRLDNDVLPARAAGMRTAFVRRGPWGHIHALKDEAALADMRVDSLRELAALFVRRPGSMKFDITHTYREHWFSVGIERTTGRHFFAFPVSVGVADYMEYYSITPSDYHSYVVDPSGALAFAEECRSRLHDDLLFIPPPANRGSAR